MKQRQKFRGSEMQQGKLKNNYKEDDTTAIELTRKLYIDQKTVETEVRPGDTLQALSIRFNCPVAELKRLNNLHRENEIHARRTLKVPFRQFSMVAVHKSGDSSPNANLTKKSVDADILKQRLSTVSTDLSEIEPVAGCSHHQTNGVTPNFNQIIFNTRLIPKEDMEDEELDEAEPAFEEEVNLLPNVEVVEPIRTDLNCSGHDWGISWPILLALILILAFIAPLVYVFCIAEEHSKKLNPS